MKRASIAKCAVLGAVLGQAAASAGSWVPGPAGPPARDFHGMAYDEGRGYTVLYGGADYPVFAGDTVILENGTFRDGPAAPAGLDPLLGPAMAYDAQRRVVVLFGGGAMAQPYLRNDTWEFDGQGWTRGPAAPAALTGRRGHGMVYDTARARMVVFGGEKPEMTDEVWEYDGQGWTLLPVAAGPEPRRSHAMAYDEARQVVVVFGGSGTCTPSCSSGYLGDVWELDGTTWRQGPTAPAGIERSYASMAFDRSRGAVVLFGGQGDPVGPNAQTYRNDTWIYDGTGWQAGPPPPPELFPRRGAGMVWDGAAGKLRLHGGYAGIVLNDTWVLGATGWSRDPDSPVRRLGPAVAYDSRRDVAVMYGGQSGAILSDTWELQGGTTWRRVPVPPAPGPIRDAGMTFDSRRGKSVMFGGLTEDPINGTTYLDGTWEYDGAGWVPGAAAPAALTPRAFTPLAYDSRRGVAVLFSGLTGCVTPGCEARDTWEYDGTAWRQGPAAPAAMSGRFWHSLDFDAARGVIVLVGGYANEAPWGPLSDVWEYDGTLWRSGTAMPTPVFPRLAHSTTYDVARKRLVVFGGTDTPAATGGTIYNDVLEFDGVSWRSGSAAPPEMGGRRAHGSYYDTRRSRIVILGGQDASYRWRHDLWEYGAVRDEIAAGAGYGQANPNRVRLFDESGQATAVDFLPFGAGAWGCLARGAELAGAALHEIVATPGPGPGLGPQVRGFVASGVPLPKVNFFAYGTLRYGANAGGVGLDADGFHEIATGPGPGAVFGPQVRGWNVDGASASPIAGVNFFAYGTLKYGVRVGGGDVDGDGFGEVLTGAGPGLPFGPHVRGFDVDGAPAVPIAKISFLAFTGTTHGVEVGGGDVDDDGFAEIAAAPGPDPSASERHVGFGYDGIKVTSLPGFSTPPGSSLFGGRLGLSDLSLTTAAELVASAGPDPSAAATIATYAYDGASLQPVLPAFDAFTTLSFGTNVGGGVFGQ